MKGAWDMGWEENSVTYQAIIERGVERGRVAEARTPVVLVGKERFGMPDEAALSALNSIDDPARLETLLRSAVSVSSWDELLATLH
jgi:hypothetical protein